MKFLFIFLTNLNMNIISIRFYLYLLDFKVEHFIKSLGLIVLFACIIFIKDRLCVENIYPFFRLCISFSFMLNDLLFLFYATIFKKFHLFRNFRILGKLFFFKVLLFRIKFFIFAFFFLVF
jgi:hypothetical protein